MSDDQLCPGTCNIRYQQAMAIYAAALTEYDETLANLEPGHLPPDPPEKPDVRPHYRKPVWCQRCQTVIVAELAELDDLISRLANLPPGIRAAVDGRREREKVSGSPEPQSPSPIADDLDELERWLLDVEREWRGRHDWESPGRRGELADRRTDVINWLRVRAAAILVDAGLGESFGEGVRRWSGKLRAATHSASYARLVKQACPGCGRFSLWELVGEEYITCIYEQPNRRFTREELAAQSAVMA